MDDQLSAKENAQKYFDKYNKLKRTFEAVTDQIAETKQEIDHLESVSTALDIALMEEDLVQIKEELMEYGYIKHRAPAIKSPRLQAGPSTTFLLTDSIFMWGRIITRMRN